MRKLSVVLLIGLPLALSNAQASKDGELWEIGHQLANDGGKLGPMTVSELCFPRNKDFKEPSEKDDPNCKTEFRASGKKTTFKSVCNDPDGIITSAGVIEEVGPHHVKSDVTITQEMRGEPRIQHRQVGYSKRIGTACDSRVMPSVFAPPDAELADQHADESLAKGSATSQGEQKADSKTEGSAAREAVEAGKSILRGLLKF